VPQIVIVIIIIIIIIIIVVVVVVVVVVAFTAVSTQRLGKHVPAATDTHETIEVLLETVFSTRYVKLLVLDHSEGETHQTDVCLYGILCKFHFYILFRLAGLCRSSNPIIIYNT
jgi:hypothetical protein